MKITQSFLLGFIILLFGSCSSNKNQLSDKPSFSGVYPHLAYFNDEGECGTGAVVPWENDLWVITYGPHMPFGSSDKLYQISPELEMVVREESTGGTPANRMIHEESKQLFIGPYAIDQNKNVRVIPYDVAPGRHTGAARHLTDPESKLYIATMEEGFYEVDVKTLDIKTLYTDGNVLGKEVGGKTPQYNSLLPGCHGKGLYSGQGVLVFSNNGEDSSEALQTFNIEAGVLAEWDGKDWKVIRRNQFTEVTGPGGIYGNKNPATDPIWALGWDYKSLILGTRENGEWRFYRLPKASFSYDGAHGWNTEWPRIRNVGTEDNPDYLMTMHGMFWKFPKTFSFQNTAGIRPRSSYLKVVGDFTRWNNQLVFGCDDSANKEFLNYRKAKGGIEGAGQSNSNLWFTDFNTPDQLGPVTASGSLWLQEKVEANTYSDAYMFSGWENKSAWIKNEGNTPVSYTFEVDRKGTNQWEVLSVEDVAANSSKLVTFNEKVTAEWIRVKTNKATKTSLSFVYAPNDNRTTTADKMFEGLATVSQAESLGGLLYGLGENRRSLGILANTSGKETGYYELDGSMNLVPKNDAKTATFIRETFAIPQNVIEIDDASVLVVDDKNRRWRLPLSSADYKKQTLDGQLRICREVATERDLFSCYGTFYELPAENADGYAKIRPISTHNLKINDYASYRGMLIMTGIDPKVKADNRHIIKSTDGKAAVWAGVIDDLWKLGKPVGFGGPWNKTVVKANQKSDPYLIGFYDKRALALSHNSKSNVTFTIEVDPTGDGTWMQYEKYTLKAGEKFIHQFPKSFQARWIRFSTDANTTATAWLEYK